MRLWIAAVGRRGRTVSGGVYEDYARRLNWPLELREVELRQTLPPENVKSVNPKSCWPQCSREQFWWFWMKKEKSFPTASLH